MLVFVGLVVYGVADTLKDRRSFRERCELRAGTVLVKGLYDDVELCVSVDGRVLE